MNATPSTSRVRSPSAARETPDRQAARQLKRRVNELERDLQASEERFKRTRHERVASRWSLTDEVEWEASQKDQAAFWSRVWHGCEMEWLNLRAYERRLPSGPVGTRYLRRDRQNALARFANLSRVDVQGSFGSVFRGRDSLDVTARTLRNRITHRVKAHHLAHWMDRASEMGISPRALREMRYWFPFVFGVRHDASQSALRSAGSRTDGSWAYQEWSRDQAAARTTASATTSATAATSASTSAQPPSGDFTFPNRRLPSRQ